MALFFPVDATFLGKHTKHRSESPPKILYYDNFESAFRHHLLFARQPEHLCADLLDPPT